MKNLQLDRDKQFCVTCGIKHLFLMLCGEKVSVMFFYKIISGLLASRVIVGTIW